jgi:hypothetical protein
MCSYILDGPEAPWGDYGHILLRGMTSHLERKNGLLQVERTAPFVPPISFSGCGNVIVTDDFKRKLQASQLSGLSFLAAEKTRIVHLEWEKWDWSKDDPEVYPESGEPEDYILERPHSPELAEQIGSLWEVCLAPHDEQDGLDFFRGKTVLYVYVSEQAKAWLQVAVPQWVHFKPAPFTR